MSFAPKAPMDLALKERIRIAYYDEDRPIAEVEEVAGVARATLYRWFHAWSWPLRKPMRSRAPGRNDTPVFRTGEERPAGGPVHDNEEGPESATGWRPFARHTLKQRLQRLVAHRIGILEHEAMAGIAVEPEANARAIERNARTLATIERLDGEPELCPECRNQPPTRSLAELRDELRRHLERIAEEERVRREKRELEEDEEDEPVPAVPDAPGGGDRGALGAVR